MDATEPSLGYQPWQLRRSIASSYSRAAGQYEAHILPIFGPMAANLVAAIGIPQDSVVLDLASGGGAVLDALKGRGLKRVVAADLSRGALLVARRRHPIVEVVGLDLESAPPFVDETFDAITCGFGFNHIADPAASLRSFLPVLKHDGRIGLTSWQQASSAPPLAQLFDKAIKAETGRKHLDWGEAYERMIGPALRRLRTPTGLRRLLRESGFRRVRVEAHLCPFVFDTPEHYVTYRLAWGGEAERAAALGPNAASILSARLRDSMTKDSALSWERTYFVATARR